MARALSWIDGNSPAGKPRVWNQSDVPALIAACDQLHALATEATHLMPQTSKARTDWVKRADAALRETKPIIK